MRLKLLAILLIFGFIRGHLQSSTFYFQLNIVFISWDFQKQILWSWLNFQQTKVYWRILIFFRYAELYAKVSGINPNDHYIIPVCDLFDALSWEFMSIYSIHRSVYLPFNAMKLKLISFLSIIIRSIFWPELIALSSS